METCMQSIFRIHWFSIIRWISGEIYEEERGSTKVYYDNTSNIHRNHLGFNNIIGKIPRVPNRECFTRILRTLKSFVWGKFHSRRMFRVWCTWLEISPTRVNCSFISSRVPMHLLNRSCWSIITFFSLRTIWRTLVLIVPNKLTLNCTLLI